MTSLDDLERSILKDARAFIEPNARDEGRVFSQLSTHLVLGGAVTIAQGEPFGRGIADRARQLLRTRKAIALSCALLGAGAGYATGYRAGKQSHPAVAAASVATVTVQAFAPSPVAAAEIERSGQEAAVEPRSASPVPTARRRAASVEHEDGAASAVVDPIAEEVALLKRAERAIRSNNALLALGLLRELDQRFPKGLMLEERAAARVMANCQASDPDVAKRMGEAYLSRAKSNLYDERVRQLCGISEATPNRKSDAAVKGSNPSGD